MACGLEGSTVQIFDPDFPIYEQNDYDWEYVVLRAHQILDLPQRGKHSEEWHNLFDPTFTPFDCTPAQAAVEVWRVIEGLDPWQGKSEAKSIIEA